MESVRLNQRTDSCTELREIKIPKLFGSMN